MAESILIGGSILELPAGIAARIIPGVRRML
jgi:hypothetical protein